MPFDEEDDSSLASKPGVKKPAIKSIFDNKVKKPSKEEADRNASIINDRLNSYHSRALELSNNYKKILEDTTLSQNKSLISIDIEAENLIALGQLAIDMNLDEQEDVGMGSVGLCSLLLRCMLIQRDKINTLDYQNYQLESRVKDLENKLEKVLVSVDTKKDGE